METKDKEGLDKTPKTKALMFLGTGSHVGKSIAVTAFCRILKRRGYDVAPFKAQNMSNNSYVTVEGGEIGRAQVVQAESAGLLPLVHMNPILLKPSTGLGAQVVLQGKVFGQMDAVNFQDYKPKLRKTVMDSYQRLAKEHSSIVMEGAGSCCEMNIKKNDLVNTYMAKAVGAPCILVADIDRGGVFAQVIGTYHLMTPKERDLLIGFIINKFRGDPGLFSSGIDYIQKKTGKPVLGLVPFFHHILIDSEDSVALQKDKKNFAPIRKETVNIAIIKLPSISNFTDMESLETIPDVAMNYLSHPQELVPGYDCLILPGTKNVMEDAVWLSRRGWKKAIQEFKRSGGQVLGICGGYQLMGKEVRDPWGVESGRKRVKGVDILPVVTTLEPKKTVRKVRGVCLMNGKRVSGYEIHMGKTAPLSESINPLLKIHLPGKKQSWFDGCYIGDGLISGTYVHGLLDSPGFGGEFLNSLRRRKGLKEMKKKQGRRVRFYHYDLLADHFEAHCDVEKILSYI